MLKQFSRIGVALMASLALVACENQPGDGGVNPTIDGVDGPHVSVAGGYVMMTFVFKDLNIEGGATIPIPKFENSSISIGPDFQSGGTLLQVAVLATDFWDGQNLHLDPRTLPGGRPLPTVGDGALPAVAVTIPQLYDTVLYIGPSVLGFFVPFEDLKMDGLIVSSNFYNAEKKKLGTISLVGADQEGKNAGLLLLLSSELLGIDSAKDQIHLQ